jgi:hypothetical protein
MTAEKYEVVIRIERFNCDFRTRDHGYEVFVGKISVGYIRPSAVGHEELWTYISARGFEKTTFFGEAEAIAWVINQLQEEPSDDD